MFSQNLEEQFILDYFKGQTDGTFCDIGANNGETLSNTRALSLLGFCGVLIEPAPKAYASLKTLYKGRKCSYTYNFAISNRNGKATLHESGNLLGVNDSGLVSTFHDEEKQRFQRTVKYQPVEVKTFTWKTALNRFSIKSFDMMSVDVEGHELTFLKDIDFTNTRLVVLEWNSKPEVKAEYDKIMQGFRIIYTSAENLIYAR